MKRIYITFGGAAYDTTASKIVADAPKLGADEVWVYDDRYILESEFYERNKWWWTKRDEKWNLDNRGFGWFIWKPYVILDALRRSSPGDQILYTDADTYPIADLSPIYDEQKRIVKPMLFRAQGCWHANWCKRDCFIEMSMDAWAWRNVDHAVARFMVVRAGIRKTEWFLRDWLQYCLNPRCNTFDASVLAAEHSELHEHRCEQAILTNMAHRHGFKLYREACQAGATQAEDQDIYPQTFFQEDCAGDKLDYSGSRYRNVGSLPFPMSPHYFDHANDSHDSVSSTVLPARLTDDGKKKSSR